MAWPFEPTDPTKFLPVKLLFAVLEDPRAKHDDGSPRFSILNVAAIHHTRDHRSVPRERRKPISELLAEHGRTVARSGEGV